MDIVGTIIIVSIVVGIFIYIRKYTMIRCPKCQSKNITKLKNETDSDGKQLYFCQDCNDRIPDRN